MSWGQRSHQEKKSRNRNGKRGDRKHELGKGESQHEEEVPQHQKKKSTEGIKGPQKKKEPAKRLEQKKITPKE